MIKKVLLLLLIFMVVGCSRNQNPEVQPTAQSPVPSPQDQGWDKALLDGALQRMAAGDLGYVDRFLLIQYGQVVIDQAYEHDYDRINAGRDSTDHPYNYYSTLWHPYYQGSDLHTLQSVTKSVVSILIGIAIQNGEFPAPSVPVFSYFEDYEIKNLDERKQRITLEDILTMRSGLEWDEWTYPVGDPRNTVTQLEMSDDWIQFILDLHMQYEPGEVFVYNSGASQLLSVMVKKATGLTIDKYAEKTLFQPLGISEYYWKKTPGGWPDTEGGLYLKVDDLAKIGILVLNQGVWEEEQLIPQAWVSEMTSRKVVDIAPDDPDWNDGYGYQWWLLKGQGAGELQVIGALGYGGQFLFIVPDLDLVAVFTGWNIYRVSSSVVKNMFMDEILPVVVNGK